MLDFTHTRQAVPLRLLAFLHYDGPAAVRYPRADILSGPTDGCTIVSMKQLGH